MGKKLEGYIAGLAEDRDLAKKQQLATTVTSVVEWLMKQPEQVIIDTVRDEEDYYGARDFIDLTELSEIKFVVNHYLEVKNELLKCGSDEDAKDALIIKLIEHEWNLVETEQRMDKNLGELRKLYSAKSSQKNDGVIDDLSEYIYDAAEMTEAQRRYIGYLKREILTNLGDELSQTLVFIGCFGVGTLVIPAMFSKGILPGILTTAGYVAVFAALRATMCFFEWKRLLRRNQEVVDTFKELGIYESLLGCIDDVRKTKILAKRSILRHVEPGK